MLKIVERMNLQPIMDKRMVDLSGGQKSKVAFARVLFENAGLLLLDEPTNHLDITTIEWLEGYLKEYKGSLVLISHDRKFLDNVTNRTVEIMVGRIHDYKVPYSKYLELRKERLEQQRAAFENQQRMIEKTEEFIEKLKAEGFQVQASVFPAQKEKDAIRNGVTIVLTDNIRTIK